MQKHAVSAHITIQAGVELHLCTMSCDIQVLSLLRAGFSVGACVIVSMLSAWCSAHSLSVIAPGCRLGMLPL